MKLLLTGPPGVGKTTLVKRILLKVRHLFHCSGFITEEVRDGSGDRIGFDIHTLTGIVAPLARKGRHEGPRVGDYRVDMDSLVHVAVPAMMDQEADLLVVDEIGLMELASPLFKEGVLELIADPRPVLGTIRYTREPFCDRVKSNVNVEVVDVTVENRDELVEMIAVRLIDEVIPQ